MASVRQKVNEKNESNIYWPCGGQPGVHVHHKCNCTTCFMLWQPLSAPQSCTCSLGLFLKNLTGVLLQLVAFSAGSAGAVVPNALGALGNAIWVCKCPLVLWYLLTVGLGGYFTTVTTMARHEPYDPQSDMEYGPAMVQRCGGVHEQLRMKVHTYCCEYSPVVRTYCC
jgi:hypothetical protein